MITTAQCLIIALASKVGAEYKVPELPALVYVESLAGEHLVGDDGASFGLGHMRLSTAKDVLRDHPKLWPGKHQDHEIILRLLQDNAWAARLAAQRVTDVGLRAYNAGVEGAKKGRGKKYPKKIQDAKQQIKACNDR